MGSKLPSELKRPWRRVKTTHLQKGRKLPLGVKTTLLNLQCTDPSTEPGTLWVAFYFPSREKGEFFDSYGNPPEHYGFKSYNIETWNQHKLQSSWSNVCGHYCIFYLYHKSRGYSMSKIVNLFTNNTNKNDCSVACYVKEHFNIVIDNQPICGLNQCCKALFK